MGVVALAGLVTACKGPEREAGRNPVDLPEQAPLVVQWADGPRRENAEREIEKQAQRVAASLFKPEPMAREPEPIGAAPVEGAAPGDEVPLPERPAWADGVERPADAGGNDLPQGWPIEVRRGETPAVLAEWAGVDAGELVASNSEALGGRKWLKVGDRITVTMSANEKVAFDRKRETFQKARVGQFFQNRYFEKVIVYRVKKGEFIATAAKRYGDVPLWLIEEFNQMDFRGLQPGDEILIPVVGELPQGVRQPPPPVVVDEEGRPLSEDRHQAVEPRLKNELFAKARMALDDSNVFARPRPADFGGNVAAPGVAPMVDPVQAAGYPRPEQVPQLPPASIGGGLLPSYSGQTPPAVIPAAPQAPAVPDGYPYGVAPAAPAAPDVKPANATLRDVVVRRGESLMHYVMWSKVSLDNIKAANQGRLDTGRIFIGARVAIPMNDDEYVAFVTARAEWEKQRLEEAAKGDDAKPAKGGKNKDAAPTKRHTVKSGETATSIAHAHRITVKELKSANPGVDLKKLKVGAKLTLPAKAK
jgi:LysM repeat protein